MHGQFRRTSSVLLLSASLWGCGASKTGVNASDAAQADDFLASEGEFSFFVISMKFIKSKAPCQGSDGKTCLGGLGGDLRNGKANGIDGADSLCAEAAQIAHPGDRHLWRAFLSAGNYNGAVLNAIDRIGNGPWYSAPPEYQGKSNYASEGLLVAKDNAGLLQLRPAGDVVTIVFHGVNQSMGAGNAQDWPFSQCLTNEFGECTQADGDTHDTLTGSKSDGTYAGSLAATCDDWTNSTKNYGMAAFGHTWPHRLNDSDGSAHWINTGEGGEACGAIINVTSTNYLGSGMGMPTLGDGGIPRGGMGGPSDGGWMPFLGDGGRMFPMDIPDGGMGFPPFDMDGGANVGWPGGPDDNMGLGGTGGIGQDSTYSGGVGSGGGYGGFYCFATITGAE